MPGSLKRPMIGFTQLQNRILSEEGKEADATRREELKMDVLIAVISKVNGCSALIKESQSLT